MTSEIQMPPKPSAGRASQRSRVAGLFAFIVSLFAVFLAAPGYAQETDAEAVEEARALYVQAVEAVKSDRPAEAADLFRQSWLLIKKPELLYNEAVARARAGQITRAAEVAEEASQLELPPELQPKNEARLLAWRLRLKTETLGSERSRELARRAIVAAREPVLQASEKSVPEVRESGLSTGEIVGISLGAGGIAALIAAGFVDLALSSQLEDVEKAAEAKAERTYATRVEQAENLQLAERVLLVSGGAMIVTGLVVWLLSGHDPPERGSRGVATVRF